MSNASDVKASNDWEPVALEDLNEKSRKLYDAYKTASAKPHMDEGTTLAFGYKWGRLSVLVVSAEKPKSSSNKKTFKLK